MNITTDSIAGRNVVFDLILEDIPGGVSLDKTRIADGTLYIGAGTPVYVDKATRVAQIVKTAITVADSASGDAVRVAKGHQFIAGESITDGYVVAVISSITTTEDDYDIIVPATTLVNFAEDAVLVEATAGAGMGDFAAVTLITATNKTLKLVDPTGKSAGISVRTATNTGDTLSVAFAGKTLTILQASTTAASNTPAVEIQTAVRALATTLGIDFSEWVVSGDELAGSGVTDVTGVMAANSPHKYAVNGFVKDTVNVEGANAECSVVVRGTVREGSLPYPVNAALKANVPLITFNV